jgi:TRAP-type C4-dicarboxylate transport system substrate-binding protein
MKNLKTAGILFVMLTVLAGSIFAAGGQAAGPTRVSVSQTSSDQHPWQKAATAFAN